MSPQEGEIIDEAGTVTLLLEQWPPTEPTWEGYAPQPFRHGFDGSRWCAQSLFHIDPHPGFRRVKRMLPFLFPFLRLPHWRRELITNTFSVVGYRRSDDPENPRFFSCPRIVMSGDRLCLWADINPSTPASSNVDS